MSIIQLRIELPTYARSFTVEIPETCTVLELKEEIYRTCPGRPRVEGQKLIWRGRFLTDDENVAVIWKPNEPRVAHLSVHPSAWAAGPPTVEATTTHQSNVAPRPTPTLTAPQFTPPTTSPTTQSSLTAERLPFVFAKHVEAIAVLMEGRTNPAGVHAMPRQREETIKLLESNGWSWPSTLDEPYPEVTPGGLQYEQVVIENVPYLSLKNADTQPTPGQAHALRVLSYTFSILTKEIREETQSQPNYTITQTIPDQQIVPNVPHINDLLQQMGLPPVHNVPNVDAIRNGEQPRVGNRLQDVPIRPLLAPLFMLVLRTSLLLYFVAPTRKPILGILILAWMLYEIWQPIRNNLLRQFQQNEQNGRQEGAQVPGVPEQPGAAPVIPGLNNFHPVRRRGQSRALMEMLGNINVEGEQRVLTEATQENSMERGLGHKVLTFFGLLVTTLHPAIWNQRRAVLRAREGTVRTEVNMRDATPRTDLTDEEAQRNEDRAGEWRRTLRERHGRRPQWVQRYMERVMAGEWVDDAD